MDQILGRAYFSFLKHCFPSIFFSSDIPGSFESTAAIGTFGLTNHNDLFASTSGIFQVHRLQLGDKTLGAFRGAIKVTKNNSECLNKL